MMLWWQGKAGVRERESGRVEGSTREVDTLLGAQLGIVEDFALDSPDVHFGV